MEPDLPPSENDVLTGEEAAEFLGISKSALLDLCRDGKLAGVKVGRHWRFHPSTTKPVRTTFRRDHSNTFPRTHHRE